MNKGQHHVLSILVLLAFVHPLTLARSTPDASLGRQLFQDGKYQEVLDVFTAIFDADSSNDSAAFHVGRVYQNQGDFDKSIQWFKKAITLNDSASEYYHQLGLTCGLKALNAPLLKKAGLARDMKKHVEKAVKLDPANIEARFTLIDIYMNMPGIFFRKTKLRRLAAEIKKRDAKKGHIALASVYDFEKKYELAERELRMLIAEDPEDSENYLRLGRTLILAKRYEKAISTLESVIAKDPQKIDAYYQIGKVGSLSGRYFEKAEANMTYFLKHSKGQDENRITWANYRLGMIYEKGNKMDKAKAAYQAALARNPKMKQAKEALKRLK